MNSHIQQGALIIATNKLLSKYNLDHPAFDPFDALIKAGRAGELFSAIRALGSISHEKFEAFRKYYKLRRSVAFEVLQIAEALENIEVAWNTDLEENSIESVNFLSNSKGEVLSLTHKIFLRLNPTKIETAILEILSETILMPQTVMTIQDKLICLGLSESDSSKTITLAKSLQLISQTEETENGQEILFNPHAFEDNATDSFNALNGLSQEKRQKAVEILEYVQSNPGIPLKKNFDVDVVKLLIKVGLIDLSKITTLISNNEKYFPTAPHLWGVLERSSGNVLSKDLIDDSKLLLNSFRYGQYFSTRSRGKIIDPVLIVNALIRNGAIGTVTPATAIGTDYPLALSRGIVNIVESRIYPGRYSMELMKNDVAEAVREVLEQKTILPTQDEPSANDLERAGQFFTSPGAVRVETELPDELKVCQEEIIFNLRTMRKDK